MFPLFLHRNGIVSVNYLDFMFVCFGAHFALKLTMEFQAAGKIQSDTLVYCNEPINTDVILYD